MKTTFIKISTSLMALLVLVSTFSVTIEKHFCGDFLVDIAYFGSTKGCADEVGDDDCDTPEIVKKKNCCKDEIQQIEGQDDLQNVTKKIAIEKHQQFLVAFLSSYNNLFFKYKSQVDCYDDYSPPKLISDIQILHEVFII